MEKSRNHRIVTIIILVLACMALSAGFAAISGYIIVSYDNSHKTNIISDVLFVSGKDDIENSEIIPTVYGLDGVTAATAMIYNNGANPTISGLNVKFTNSGQSATYSFYVKNKSKSNAYLKSILYENTSYGNSSKECIAVGDTDESSVQRACKYITLSVKIGNITTIGTKGEIHGEYIEPGDLKKIEVTIDYAEGAYRPIGEFKIEFGDIKLIYDEFQ